MISIVCIILAKLPPNASRSDLSFVVSPVFSSSIPSFYSFSLLTHLRYQNVDRNHLKRPTSSTPTAASPYRARMAAPSLQRNHLDVRIDFCVSLTTSCSIEKLKELEDQYLENLRETVLPKLPHHPIGVAGSEEHRDGVTMQMLSNSVSLNLTTVPPGPTFWEKYEITEVGRSSSPVIESSPAPRFSTGSSMSLNSSADSSLDLTSPFSRRR